MPDDDNLPSDSTWDIYVPPRAAPKEKDDVNNPSHYNTSGMETIDLIKQSMSSTEFKGYLTGNILKYVSRYHHKHPAEPQKDLLKAQRYLNKLLQEW